MNDRMAARGKRGVIRQITNLCHRCPSRELRMPENTDNAGESAQDVARSFAEDLARLRELHGSPSFERMHAAIRHVAGAAGSKNTFHRMASNPGQIYGPEFVRGFILALGLSEDAADDWEQRRVRALQRYQLLRDSAAAPGNGERKSHASGQHPSAAEPSDAHPAGRSNVLRSPFINIAASPRLRWIAVLVLAAAVSLAVILVLLTVTDKTSPPESRPRVPVKAPGSNPVRSVTPPRDGADPEDSGCSLDPQVTMLDSAEVDFDSVPAGLAELIYSPLCGVAWSRFQPFPDARIPAGSIVHVYIIRPASGNLRMAFQAPYVGAPVYGNVLRSTEYCVYAEAAIADKGKELPASRTRCFRGKTPEG